MFLRITEQLVYVYAQLTQINSKKMHEHLNYKEAKYCNETSNKLALSNLYVYRRGRYCGRNSVISFLSVQV